MTDEKQKHEDKKMDEKKTEIKNVADASKDKSPPHSDLVDNDKEQKHPASSEQKHPASSEQKHPASSEQKHPIPKSSKEITKSEVVDNDKVKDSKKSEKVKQIITKKDEAVANGLSMHTSKKHCMYIGAFIKGKPIDLAIAQLEEVIKMKRAIPFKGEIPHRHQEGIMSGRYPVKACGLFIPLLKGLKGNVLANQMDLDKTRISLCVPNWASRPSKSGGRRAKRVNVLLKAREVSLPQRVSELRGESSKSKSDLKKAENKSGEKI